MMRLDLDVKYVRDQITALLLANPELAEDEVLREDMIEGSTTTFEFLSKIVRLIGDNDAKSNGLHEYIKQLETRWARLANHSDVLRSFIYGIMTGADLQKVQLPEATLSIRAGQPKIIFAADDVWLPDEYVRIKREPNKTAIKEALLSGAVIPGAALSNAEPTLAIRVK